MKKSIKSVLFTVTACVLGLTFAGCGGPKIPPSTGDGGGEASNWQDNMHRDENDFLQDDNRRPSREPFVDETPEEAEGATLTPVRFEAEHAKIRGTTNGEDHFCTGKSIEFSPSFSGNVALCNLGTATLTFTFNSDKAVRSKMLVRMSNQYSGSTGGVLSAYANMTVNDKPVVDLSSAFDPESGEAASGSSASYFTMVTLETKISLAEGKNTLAITPATANYLNLDYIEIQTSATVKDKTEPTITEPSSFVNVQTAPTEETAGKIAFTCHNKKANGEEVVCKNDNARARNLPALTDPIYTKHDWDNGTGYTANMFGENVVIASTVVWDLTLVGATFADGSTTAKFAPGASPVINYDTPEGKAFSHWEDADGNNLGATFKMPDKAITIKPVFVSVYTLTLDGARFKDGGTSGKFKAGETPELEYDLPAKQIFDHWEDSEGNNLGTTFTMPEKDIKIKPVFIDSNEVTITLQGATFNGETVINAVAKRELDLSEAVIENKPEGKILKGWFDVSDRTKLYSVSFTVPDEDLTLAPLFEAEKKFYSDKTYTGKIDTTGNLYGDKEKGCYSVIDNKTTGAINTGKGYYEYGNIYHFKGGTADKPAETMAVGSYFLSQEMNGKTGAKDHTPLTKTHTVTTTVENFGSEAVTLRFALVTGSSNPDSQFGEKTVTIAAGATVTFEFDINKLHGSFMLNIMVKDKAVSEVHIGLFQYVDVAASQPE